MWYLFKYILLTLFLSRLGENKTYYKLFSHYIGPTTYYHFHLLTIEQVWNGYERSNQAIMSHICPFRWLFNMCLFLNILKMIFKQSQLKIYILC